MRIIPIFPKIFASNTYILISDEYAILVDPAVPMKDIENALIKSGATLIGVLLTHGHFDHVTHVDTIREKYGVPIYIHKDDACMLTNGKINGFYDLLGYENLHAPADKLFEDGDTIKLGDESITVMHTPGHTLGSSCFIFNDEDGKTAIITGDTIFSNSIGRTDLYGGDFGELKRSISKLSAIDCNSKIYPGHNDSSTLGEALYNISAYL